MKNSGVEWIGEIPDDWEVSKTKYLTKLYTGNSIKDEEKDLYEDKADAIPYISSKDINAIFSTTNYENGMYVKHSDNSFVRAPAGSTLMCIEGGSAGKKKTFLNQEVCFVNKLCCFSPIKIDNKFLFYCLNSPNYEEEFRFNISGMIGGVSVGKLNQFILPKPPKSTQQRIASYLDKKCSKIEETIQNQQQVIEKLKAYKQSLITEAVTGKVKIENGKICGEYESYKDSGVEYLGKIPLDWNIKRLRYIGKCQNGISKGGEFFGSGYPFVSYGDVYNNLALPETVAGLIESTHEEQENYSVKAGDIFFTRTSETIEEVGFTSVCLKTIKNATFAGFVIRVRPFTDELIPDYSKYYFSSDAHRRFFVKEMNLVTRASLSQDLLKRLPVLIPSKEKQKEIADYLDKKCTAIDTVIEQKQKLIKKLTEYKKSMIYEVVTGKKEVN